MVAHLPSCKRYLVNILRDRRSFQNSGWVLLNWMSGNEVVQHEGGRTFFSLVGKTKSRWVSWSWQPWFSHCQAHQHYSFWLIKENIRFIFIWEIQLHLLSSCIPFQFIWDFLLLFCRMKMTLPQIIKEW